MAYLIIYGLPWFLLTGLATALWPAMPKEAFPCVSGGAALASVVFNWKVEAALRRRLGWLVSRMIWGCGMLGLAVATVTISLGDTSDRAIAVGGLIVATALGAAVVSYQRRSETADWNRRRAGLEPFRQAARNPDPGLGASALLLIFVPCWIAPTSEMYGHNFAIVTGILSIPTLEPADRSRLEGLRERLAAAIREEKPRPFDVDQMSWLVALCHRLGPVQAVGGTAPTKLVAR